MTHTFKSLSGRTIIFDPDKDGTMALLVVEDKTSIVPRLSAAIDARTATRLGTALLNFADSCSGSKK